jgi:hypothetical protein
MLAADATLLGPNWREVDHNYDQESNCWAVAYVSAPVYEFNARYWITGEHWYALELDDLGNLDWNLLGYSDDYVDVPPDEISSGLSIVGERHFCEGAECMCSGNLIDVF